MKKELELTIHEAVYGNKKVLGALLLRIKAGECVGIIGPNGAGKTSVLRALIGSKILETNGVLKKDGINISRTSSARRVEGIAYVPQQYRVFPSLTIKENVRLGQTLSRENKDFDEAYVKLTKVFPILSQGSKIANQLSGGEQQMVALARALAQKPDFLILDEPTVGISPRSIRTLLDYLKIIRKELNIGCLIVEHNLEALFEIADRIYVISNGAVVLEGTPEEIRSNPELKEVYFGK